MMMKKFLSEFKTFAIRGNMLDITAGVVVGGAFTAIINSIVTNIATPLIGILIGVDFKEWVIELPRLYGNAEAGKLGIGLFINSIISFIIVAFTLFIFVKGVNTIRSRHEAAPKQPEVPAQERLLTEIRDLLKEESRNRGER